MSNNLNPKCAELLRRLEDFDNGWNKWRAKHPEDKPDLSGCDFNEWACGVGSFMDLNSAPLHHVDFSDTNLGGAILSGAMLYDSNLSSANLSRADLAGAFLDDANLKGADLRGASLRKTRLVNADLEGAKFGNTVFGDTNLAGAKGLNTCRHDGPSTLDFATLAKARWLPLQFLRGCGLPDTVITNLPSLFGESIQFNSCFISYSIKDREFAERLYADLQNQGIRCWYAPHSVQGGKKLHEQLDEAIQTYDRLLLVLTQASMESEWVKTEIANARKRELREKRRVVFPLRLVDFDTLRSWKCFDADTGKDSAREIREYYIPDFSNWKAHDDYRREFEKLLHDLKAEPLRQ